MHSLGSPAFARASCIMVTAALFELMASFPPLKMQTFPDLRQSAAASTVTFGLASKIMAITPRGTLFLIIRSPLGLVTVLSATAVGSGSAITSLTPSAMPFMLSGVSLSLSSIAADMPFFSAFSISVALASSHSALRSISASAIAFNASFLTDVPAVISIREAFFASMPCCSSAVMPHLR